MISKKRKLIFVWSYLAWGGSQIYYMSIMKQARTDWDIVVILPRDSSPEILGYLDGIGVRYEFIDACLDFDPAPTMKRRLQVQWRRFRTETELLRHLGRYNLNESVLQIETAPWQSWQLLTALSLRGANVFVALHNALPRFPMWRELVWKARMQFVSRLPGFHMFTSNHDTKNKFHGWVEEKFWQDIKVTTSGINPPEIDAALDGDFDRDALRRRHGIAENSFLVLCVGQFIDRKGRWVFMDAAKKVIERGPDISFAWLTPQMPAESDLERVKSYGLTDKVRLVLSASVGSSRHEILQFIRSADVFALPSYIEGLPIALLEAMALGVPCISTNINAIPEAIKNRETGILIEAGDNEALANSILELKENTALRREIAESGRRYVLENFDERVSARIAIEAYEECFANGG